MFLLKKIKPAIIGALVLALPAVSRAAGSVPDAVNPFGNNPDLKSPVTDVQTQVLGSGGILGTIVHWVYVTFFIIAVLFFLLAAYNFMLGGSDEKKIATAKNQLKYGVIAIVVALLSVGAAYAIDTFLRTGA